MTDDARAIGNQRSYLTVVSLSTLHARGYMGKHDDDSKAGRGTENCEVGCLASAKVLNSH